MKRICVAILTLAALSLFQLACSSGNQTTAPANTTTQNSTTQTVAEQPANNATQPANANAPASVTKPTANANAGDDDPFPELVMLYSQLFTARMKGDKSKVEGLLADDFKEMTGDGKTLNKQQVLEAVNDNRKAVPYQLDDLKAKTTGDSGTVTARVTITEEGHIESWQANMAFKKQQGRWVAVSSKMTDYKKS